MAEFDDTYEQLDDDYYEPLDVSSIDDASADLSDFADDESIEAVDVEGDLSDFELDDDEEIEVLELEEEADLSDFEEQEPLQDDDEMVVESEDVAADASDVASDASDATSDTNEFGWLSDINPNYDPFDYESPYSTNCGTCALAVARRLNGEDDMAVASDHTLSDPEMAEALNADLVSMSPDDIAASLRSAGPGANAVIGIDRAEGAGHWFNAICPDGVNVYALDGQTGEMQPWPPDYGDVVNWEMSVKR